ncbi:unnamed protein product [Staurois parvus]|uniref:Uncharacterized protein n=1 Tax=Staurois parvus TaxID=386267 RepID=A0ABN9D557_9NEOB|nr:unnamed protein product [Staurois parvus]
MRSPAFVSVVELYTIIGISKGTMPHAWCQWEEWCPIIGVSGKNGATSLVSVGGMMPYHWCQWEK